MSLAMMKQHVTNNRLNSERQDHDTFERSVHAPISGGNEAGHGGSVTRDSNKEPLAAGNP